MSASPAVVSPLWRNISPLMNPPPQVITQPVNHLSLGFREVGRGRLSQRRADLLAGLNGD